MSRPRLSALALTGALLAAPSVPALEPPHASVDREWATLEAEIDRLDAAGGQAKVTELAGRIQAAAGKLQALPPAERAKPEVQASSRRGQATLKRLQDRVAALNQARPAASSADNALMSAFHEDFKQVWNALATSKVTDFPASAARFDTDLARLEAAFAKVPRTHPGHGAATQNMEKLRATLADAKAKAKAAPAAVPAAGGAGFPAAATSVPGSAGLLPLGGSLAVDWNQAGGPKLEFVDERAWGFFAKDYGRFYQGFEKIDTIALQKPAEQEAYRSRIATLKDRIGKIANQQHPRVQLGHTAIRRLEATLDAALSTQADLKSRAGDVDGQIALLKDQFSREKFQPELKDPLSVEKVSIWAASLKDWEKAHSEGVKFLENAAQFSVEARTDAFKAYFRWYRDDLAGRIAKARDEGVDRIVSRVEQERRRWTWFKPNLADEKLVAGLVADLEAAKDLTLMLEAFEEAYKGAKDARWAGFREEFETRRVTLLGGADQAIKDARLPAAVSTDGGLLAAAQAELVKPERGFGEVVRVVINAPLQKYEQVVWERDGFFLRKWEQFQVAFVEKVGTDHWIAYAQVKKIHQGSPTDIVGRWYVANQGTFRSRRILAENIHR